MSSDFSQKKSNKKKPQNPDDRLSPVNLSPICISNPENVQCCRHILFDFLSRCHTGNRLCVLTTQNKSTGVPNWTVRSGPAASCGDHSVYAGGSSKSCPRTVGLKSQSESSHPAEGRPLWSFTTKPPAM